MGQPAITPDVTLKALGSATRPDTALYILAQHSLNGQVIAGPTGASVQVYRQNPKANAPAPASKFVELTTRIAP